MTWVATKEIFRSVGENIWLSISYKFKTFKRFFGSILIGDVLKSFILSFELRMAENEFRRIKLLFDNGLISVDDFESKRAKVKERIRVRNLIG